ncbi:MAG: DUF1540 domain-containing protein [Clostridia bacterium]|nr:DUF1540 domain-containing protein [Clostridia bacterium]MBR2327860.1 DUF1540 domain-containing protein [Clostridia bacterium]
MNQQNEQKQCSAHNICCVVKSCIHHTEDNGCNAKTIKVGPQSACKCNQTECATFEEKPQS